MDAVSASNSEYQFVELSDENVGSLAQGLSECHAVTRGERRPPGYWQWRYVENPAKGCATVVALRGGEVVGILGNTYVRFHRGQEICRAGAVGDLTIRPDARSWRCFAELHERSAQRAIRDRIAFGYGFVVRQQEPAGTRLGAAHLGEVPVYSGFLSTAGMLAGRGIPAPLAATGHLIHPLLRVRPRSADPGVVVEPLLGRFGPEFDGIGAPSQPVTCVSAVRDSAYLNWRYLDRPDREYICWTASVEGQCVGYAVCGVAAKRRAGYLDELRAKDGAQTILDSLISSLVADLRVRGVGVISGSFPEGSAESAALRRARFQAWTSRLWKIELVVTTDLGWGVGPELHRENWRFNLGDWLTH